MTIHRNGTATSAVVVGAAETPSLLEGPGFSLAPMPESGDSRVVFRVDGRPAPEQVLRLLAQYRVLAGRTGDHIDVRIETTDGYDRYVYTRDLRHRLLFRRAWDRQGPVGVFYGLNPFTADTEGPIDQVPRRTTLRNVVASLSRDLPLSRIDVMNLFTYRSPDAATLPARPQDRVAVPELEREVLAAADVVLLAWGAKVKAGHQPAVDDLLSRLQELGKTPIMLARNGEPVFVGNPLQPAHPARVGSTDVTAIPMTMLGLDRPRPEAPPPTPPPPPVRSEPRSRTMESRDPETPAPTAASSSRDHGEILTWVEGLLDPLGVEAVRRYLAGEAAVANPALPDPEAVAAEAYRGRTAWDALQLVVVALRITDGIAWWKPAARYVLADTATPRDRVSGTWGNAARKAFEYLLGLEVGSADDAAPSGLSHDLRDTAQRWGVADDDSHSVFGPGAPKQFEHVVEITDGSQRPCYRLV